MNWLYGFTREEHLAALHVDIHRKREGCCCTDPLRIVVCPGCPRHVTARHPILVDVA